jgi:preprotein translocase subunit SecE
MMSTKTETPQASPLDTAKLALAVAVLLSGLVAYYVYDQWPTVLRVGAVLLALAAALVVVYQTARGKLIWRFIQGSQVEVRKVIWPTRQETLQTTLTVLVFVFILGIFFWLLDMGLLWITKLATGQGS